MAGWFEAFANFAKAGAQGLDRYQQLRQLDEENRIKRKQLELENSWKQQQFNTQQQLAEMQMKQLQAALTRQERSDWQSSLFPGQEISEADRQRGLELGVPEGLLPKGGQLQQPFEVPNQGVNFPSYILEREGASPLMDAEPFNAGSMYNLPERGISPNRYMGTPQQQMEAQKLEYERLKALLPILQSQQLQKAIMGADFNDPRDLAMLGSMGLDNISSFMQNQYPNTEFGILARTAAGEKGGPLTSQELIRLQQSTQQQRQPFESPYPVWVKDIRDGRTRPVSAVEAMGPNSKFYVQPDTADVRNRDAAMGRIAPILDIATGLADRINISEGVAATAEGRWKWLQSKVNQEPDVAEYMSFLKGTMPMVARAMGHSGVLTELDESRTFGLFPQPWDSKDLKDRKLANIYRIVNNPSSTPMQVLTPAGDVVPVPTNMLWQAIQNGGRVVE